MLDEWLKLMQLSKYGKVAKYLRNSFLLIYKMEKVILIFRKDYDKDHQNKSVCQLYHAIIMLLIIINYCLSS